MLGSVHKCKVHNLSHLNENDNKCSELIHFDNQMHNLKIQCDKERSISSNILGTPILINDPQLVFGLNKIASIHPRSCNAVYGNRQMQA